MMFSSISLNALILLATVYVLGVAGSRPMNSTISSLGVNWGVLSSHSVPPEMAVEMLKDNGIQKVKLFIADEGIMNALSGTGIEVMVAIPNGDLEAVNDYTKAKEWVRQNVTRYNTTSPSGVNIKYVAIGNEPFLVSYKGLYTNLTFPALENIQRALNEAGLGDKIKATVPLNADIYNSPSYNPVPSAGTFRPDIKDKMVQILELLHNNSSPFIINIYPFLNLYLGRPGNTFPKDYAFFDGKSSPLVDTANGFKYYNSFDAAYDGLFSAMKAEGFENMTIIIGEIGWPTDGDQDANLELAMRFYGGFLPKLASKSGTPLRPGLDIPVYLFELFDEDAKSVDPGTFERHWGLFTYDGQPKIPGISLRPGSKGLVPARNVTYLPNKWCALKPEAAKEDPKVIEEKVDYACDRADCTKLSNGSSCSGLNASDKASYAFNAYFQAMNQVNLSCDFQGLAAITTKNISLPNCKFDIQLAVPRVDAPTPTPAPAPAPAGTQEHAPGRNAPSSSSSSSAGASSSSSGASSFSSSALLLLVAHLSLVLI